jgi:hypothetical protein
VVVVVILVAVAVALAVVVLVVLSVAVQHRSLEALPPEATSLLLLTHLIAFVPTITTTVLNTITVTYFYYLLLFSLRLPLFRRCASVTIAAYSSR